MVNKPKAIGTAGETAVLRAILPYYPTAYRLVLAGSQDKGDIRANEDTIFEVKAGAQTKQIGDKKLAGWLAEAETERVHSRATFGFLITQRAGVGAPNALRWWAWTTLEVLGELCGSESLRAAPVRLELGALLELLADTGFSDTRPEKACLEQSNSA